MYLSENKVKYIFHHLWQHVRIHKLEPHSIIIVNDGNEIPPYLENKVIFLQSSQAHPEPYEIIFHGKKIPILFGAKDTNGEIYHCDTKGNLIFRHDLLSSAFYLLSGQQEIEIKQKDQHGRFPFELSIQKKLNFVHLPVVNYYFEMITEGLETFAQKHNKKIDRLRLFDSFAFFLSHDVDRIAFHHPFYVLYRLKQFLGLSPSNLSKSKIINLFFQGLGYNLNPFKKEDPWWNFGKLINLEKKLGIRSTYYFLKREDGFKNSLYHYKNKKIKNLISTLKKEGFEVGLHGTYRSAEDGQNLSFQKQEFETATGTKPIGIRQHYLRFSLPHTFKLQSNAGLKYDTSLAFAEHDGYRNSYCYPFRPYDFEADQMMPIWEIPLIMMEVSVLNYRQASFKELQQAVNHYIQEARKFGGLFSLLWHNCRINDIEMPGISNLYNKLLESIIKEKPHSLRGMDIYDRVSTLEQEPPSDIFKLI